MAKIEWMPVPEKYTGRQLELTYNTETILIEIWSYYENPDRLYYFNITEQIPYKGRTIVARYSLDNIEYNGTFYSLELCQSFIEKLLDDCEERKDDGFN
jgi:hypothetical protein